MKYLFTLLFICCTIACNCQIDKPIKKGNIILGGGVGFSYSKESGNYKVIDNNGQSFYQNIDQKSISFSFGPSFGYFLIDGLAVGLSPSFSYSNQEFSSYTFNNYSFGIAPYAKYYFNNGIFIHLKADYYHSVSKQKGFDNKTNYNYLTINPGIGYAFFINSKVSIEPSLEYSFMKNKEKSDNMLVDSENKTNKLFFSLGFQIFL
jgi:outer membrane protein